MISTQPGKIAEIELLMESLRRAQKGEPTLLDILPVGISIAADVSCKEILHNSAAAEFFRVRPWDNLSHSSGSLSPFRIFHEGKELSPEEMPVLSAAWQGKEVRDYEIEVVWDDGVHKSALWNTRPLKDDQGNTTGAVASFKDITEHKQAENALKEGQERYRSLSEELEQRVALRTVELSNSEERLRTIIENIVDCFAICTAIRNDDGQIEDFLIEYVNEAACKDNAMTREEQVGNRLLGTLPIHKNTKLFDEYCQVVETGKPLSRERLVWDEAYPQHLISAYDLRLAKLGDGLVVSWSNITERKRAAEALRESEEKYRMVFNATGTAAVIVEEATTISHMNREFETLTGYSKEEIEGKTSWKELIAENYLDDMIRYHKLRRADPDFAPKQYETALLTRQGDIKHVIVTISMIPKTNQSIVFMLDISKIKNADKAIRQSEEKFRTLFKDAPVGIGIARSGITVMANRAYLSMFGHISATELKGTSLLDQIAPQCRMQVEEIIRGREQGKESPRTYETVGMRKDGSTFPLYTETSFMELPDGMATISYFTDITERKRMEEELLSSEKQLRLIMDTIPSRMAYVDSERCYKYVNKEHEVWYGVEGEYAQGKHIWEVVGEEDYHKMQTYIDTALSGERVFYDIELPSKGGEKHYFYMVMVPEIDERGTVRGYVSLATDMTEFRAMERETAEALELSQAIVDSSPLGICTIDSSGQFVFANDAAAIISGETKEQILQQNINNIESKHTGMLDAAKLVLKTGVGEQRQFSMKTNLGKELWFEHRLNRFTSDGKPHLLLVYDDITERKEAEEALRQSEERFSRVFHSNPCQMSIVSLTDNRYIEVNQQWLEAVGISREEVIGKTRDEVGLVSESQFQNILKALSEHGAAQNQELVYLNKKGEERYDLQTSELITINGEPCLIRANIDITERKKYEKEMTRLDRLDLMGEIAGGIAKEIRNPMTVVRGYLQLIQAKEEFVSQKKRFDTMIGEIDRANAIITEFLSLAKDKPEEMKRQNINNIVTALVPLIQADVAKRQVAVSVDLADVPDVNLDEKEIRQVILNLVRNGVEAMPQAGELTIKTSSEQDRVVLSIKDQGSGIPPEVLEKLGTPFFTTKDTGTGLGLSICYRIAENHNARIEIESNDGGTTFMVSFPISSSSPLYQDEGDI